MSLAQTPLSSSPPPSASSSSAPDGCVFLDEILLHDMLTFEERGAAPFVAQVTPAARMYFVGCSDATSSSTPELHHAYTYAIKPNLSRQTTPTSIDSYIPPANEYAQLAELWSSSPSYTVSASPTSALASVVLRENSLAPLSPRAAVEPGDALLDLFMQVMPAESIADPAARHQVCSSTKFTPTTITSSTPRGSSRHDKKRKISSSSSSFKSKKCTYAARRVSPIVDATRATVDSLWFLSCLE